MSEPRPWLEEGAPADIEQLFRAAQTERPSEASLARTLAALSVGLGVTGIAGAAAAAGVAGTAASGTAGVTAITAGVLVKWTALGATLGTLVAGAAATITRDAPLLARAPAPSVQPLATSGSESTRAAPSFPEPAAAPSSITSIAEPVVGQPPSPAAPAPAPAPGPLGASAAVAPAPGTPLDAETLAEEVRSVDQARAALTAGRAAEALSVLDDYERRFPTRGFAPEALYLRMEAFIALGRTAQARTTAERLLGSFPSSPHGARARAVLSKIP